MNRLVSLLCMFFGVTCLILFAWATYGTTQELDQAVKSETNECVGDPVNGGNCANSQHQVGSNLSYEPTNLAASPYSTSNSYNDIEYANDRLSDLDLAKYKSINATEWRAANQDTLKQVLIVHRHGDRTPISFPPRDNLAKEPFWQFNGLGQLTNRGKARLHMLGKIIRQRYNIFLNGSVNKNMRKSRASGSLRCIESAQVFLSSFLSLDNTNSPDASSLIWDKQSDQLAHIWQPASILTLSAKYDAMLNEGADCEILEAEYKAYDDSVENKQLLIDFKNVADVMKQEIGFEMDHFYKWFWGSSQLEVERSYFEHKMNPKLLEIYDQLEKAGERYLKIYQSSLKTKRVKAGMLINDIIENMNDIRTPNRSPFSKKFVHYSAHDVTIFFLLGLLDNVEKYPSRPDYASNIIFELHQDQDEWFVKIFYMKHVPSKPVELHLDSCEQGHAKGRCTLDKFSDVMQKYCVANWTSWMQECGNSLSSFDPYDQNF